MESALKSANVDAPLSPSDLVTAADASVSEDKFGEGGRPLNLWY
jgi:hypothetical protein